MKHEPATRTHSPDDPPAMVIHHPEEDETLLARWLRRAMAKGASFWFLAGGTLVALIGVSYLISSLATGQSATSQAWGEVMLANSPEDYQRIADTNASTPASAWASLMAANARYREGLERLPADRDAAGPILTQALENFKAVEEKAKSDPMLKRLAMLGIARTHETRDELTEAIDEYEKIAANWPDTDDGKQAAERVKKLKAPDTVSFYKQFAAYKPKPASPTTIGPRGSNRLMDDLPFGHPSVDGPMIPAPALNGGVPAGSVPSAATPKPEGGLPSDVFQKSTPAKGDAAPGPKAKDDSIPDVFPAEPPADKPATPQPR